MTDHEQNGFEAQLRQLKPGKLPAELVSRIEADMSPSPSTAGNAVRSNPFAPGLMQVLRWLIPATAAFLITAVIWHGQEGSREQTTMPSVTLQKAAGRKAPLLKADNVEIGKELVSSFDAVATLPGGEPVRFRCQQWMSKVVVDDEKQGLLVERRMPRVIVVPVGFETY